MVERLRRSIMSEYAESVGLSPDAKYISGAPLRPVVPLDTGSVVFVIGAYPSARFHSIDRHSNVPVADNLGPFEPERYYDGQQVRRQDSAAELQEHLLGPLGVRRSDCWITDLVKVFLFKEGHRAKCQDLGARAPDGYRREDFDELGRRSVVWGERELKLAKPTLVVTLGAEVAGILRGIVGEKARVELLDGVVAKRTIGATEVNVAHLPHPGILMRPGPGGGPNPWVERNKEFVSGLAEWLRAAAPAPRAT